MNTRKKGRKFEKQEEKVWKAAGWETELVRPEARFIGPGKFVTAYRDFFGGRYDLLALWPPGRVICLVQVSTESPSSHSDPGPFGLADLPVPVDVLLTLPPVIRPALAGVYEVYSQYIRGGRGYRGYVARRTWWTR